MLLGAVGDGSRGKGDAAADWRAREKGRGRRAGWERRAPCGLGCLTKPRPRPLLLLLLLLLRKLWPSLFRTRQSDGQGPDLAAMILPPSVSTPVPPCVNSWRPCQATVPRPLSRTAGTGADVRHGKRAAEAEPASQRHQHPVVRDTVPALPPQLQKLRGMSSTRQPPALPPQ